jgi:hypothetical protein
MSNINQYNNQLKQTNQKTKQNKTKQTEQNKPVTNEKE